MRFSDYLTLISRIGKIIPGSKRIGNLLTPKRLEEAIKYLYGPLLQVEHFVVGVLTGGIATFWLCILLLSRFVHLLSAGILSLSFTIMFILISLNRVTWRYEREIGNIAQLTPYVLEELVTIYLTSGSIFSAILYVSRGEYGPISSELEQMIEPLNRGLPPEQLLMDFAMKQPSITLRRGFLAFIHFVETQSGSLEVIIKEAHENLQRRFEQLTLQWESRMTVFAGILVFLPLICVLGLAIRGLASNPVIFLLPALLYGLSGILRPILLPRNDILVGE